MINGVWCFAPPFIALVYGMFEIVLRRCEEIIWVMKDTSSFCCDLEVCGDAATIIHVVILSDQARFELDSMQETNSEIPENKQCNSEQ